MAKPTTDDVQAKLLEVYLRGTSPTGATAAEMAAELGCSATKARALLESCPTGMVFAERQWRSSQSRDYPGMTVGQHRVTVYAPSRFALVREIKRLRASAEE